jgi:hypothetical protein
MGFEPRRGSIFLVSCAKYENTREKSLILPSAETLFNLHLELRAVRKIRLRYAKLSLFVRVFILRTA